MKILFATKLIEDRNFQPLGIYHISAMLKKGGHETYIVDATSYKAVFEAVHKLNPHILAISTPTARYRFFQKLAAQLKAKFPKLFVVVGGIHTTLIPESVKDEGIDAVCIGDGDYVLLELVNKLEHGENYLETTGFWFNKSGDIVKNPVAPLIVDLDSLPFADREITDVYLYCRNMPVGVFVTSRGCPFSCSFCSNAPVRSLYDNAHRFFRANSPARAIEEVDWAVKKYGYKRLVFMNEVFGVDKRWLMEFTSLYAREIGIPFWCMLHPNMVDEERAEMLSYAGCNMVELGIESGNEHIRQNILKRQVTDEQIVNSVRLLHKYKIKVQTSNILGIPESDLKKDIETVDLNLKAEVDFPDVCIFQPLPKTPLADMAIKTGLFDGNYDDLPPTINPSAKRVIKIKVPHRKLLENLGFLFPIVARSKAMRKILPVLIRLPLRPLYLFLYKTTITLFKLKYILGAPSPSKLFSSQFVKIFLNYIRY